MNKYESILYLENPKILSNIFTNSYSNHTVIKLNNTSSDYSNHFNRNKNNILQNQDLNISDNKKSKKKYKKKIRNNTNKGQNSSQVKHEMDYQDLNYFSSIKNPKNKKNHTNKVILKDQTINNHTNLANDVYLNDSLTVKELASKLHIASTDIIKWLFLQGISVTINQLLDLSIATLVAKHYSFNVLQARKWIRPVSGLKINHQDGELRAPIITLLGHVDHGKTTLLRAIKQDSSLIQEVGDITQSIGSYEVLVDNYKEVSKLIFLDTPGHEAFISIRQRGADITDLVVLVVAADDGLKPQTIEAINHVQSKNLPFIVAINKIDKVDADINKVKSQLIEFNISTQSHSIIEVSALNRLNIDVLLSALITLSQSFNLKSNPSVNAQGTILDAKLSKQKGSIAQLLIQDGTLKIGNIIVAGNIYGKVKAIYNYRKQSVQSIQSTALAEVLCFTEVPKAGVSFHVVNNEKEAKDLASRFIYSNSSLNLLNNRISLDNFKQKGSKSIIKQVNLIIKTDTQGSIDAIIHALAQFPQEKVKIHLLMVSCGEISFKDLNLASTSNSVILVFNLKISSNILQYAEKKHILVHSFYTIYDLIDYVQDYMLSFLDVNYKKHILGYAEVRNLFIVNKGVVAGCFVKNGKLKKNFYFQLKRSDRYLYNGLINSLKILKTDVDEVDMNNECGVMCKDYNSWKIQDILECYDLYPEEKTL